MGRVAALAALLVVLATSCQAIEVRADGVTSHASMAVSPTTVRVAGTNRAAIEIRMRDCHTLHFIDPPSPVPDLSLRPVAHVTAADGRVLFSNTTYAEGSYVEPAGSSVVGGGTSDAHRIVVPVAGARTPIKISAGCTSYPGYGSAPFRAGWSFPECTTSNRTCAATRAGAGRYSTS